MRPMGRLASALGVWIVFGTLLGSFELAHGGVTIRLATEATSLDPTFELPKKFKELLEAKARAALDVKFFSGGALGTQRQAQEQIHLGAVEAISTASDMPELEPKFGIFDFPFLFSERQHVFNVLDGTIGEELNQILIRNKGVRVLAYGELGFRQFTNSVRPITKPDDLKGLKIRVPPAKIRVAAIRAMGAAATPMP
jgi:TRAP-type C4-dicarboxylate transport system substrate-binding protein